MVGSQLKVKNPLILVFPAFVYPSSVSPLFLSSVSSLCGSPTGTDVSLKTLAKSFSKCGFIDLAPSHCTAG